MTDALMFYGDVSDPERKCANVIVADVTKCVEPPETGVEYVQMIGPDSTELFRFDSLYLPDIFLLPDFILDKVIEHAHLKKPKLILDASRRLEDVGKCDVKYGCSPVFYLYKLGLLSGAFIAGGLYLDRDDVDLMVQENASLILTPTYDAGVGNGIPALRMYLDRGLKISLGTFASEFNPQRSIRFEAEVLRLLVNGAMCGAVVGDKDIKRIMGMQ